ncbi:hypothetical protein CgunFtcFv8_013060 [Champsocephalus gunnari]|uniref:Uncharacterized protein n=1 Tax=Champsocephalus gunnari TaxID=52237 RepID=A0AAN8DRJ4_CHAGU|nr:hypothetical protein CgunFtcFv8_013060 [Champsocephalus gunnari]
MRSRRHFQHKRTTSTAESSEELEDNAQTEQSCLAAVYFSLPMHTIITNLRFGQALCTPRNNINCGVLKKNP